MILALPDAGAEEGVPGRHPRRPPPQQGRDPDALTVLFVVNPIPTANAEDTAAVRARRAELTQAAIDEQLQSISYLTNLDFAHLRPRRPAARDRHEQQPGHARQLRAERAGGWTSRVPRRPGKPTASRSSAPPPRSRTPSARSARRAGRTDSCSPARCIRSTCIAPSIRSCPRSATRPAAPRARRRRPARQPRGLLMTVVLGADPITAEELSAIATARGSPSPPRPTHRSPSRAAS